MSIKQNWHVTTNCFKGAELWTRSLAHPYKVNHDLFGRAYVYFENQLLPCKHIKLDDLASHALSIQAKASHPYERILAYPIIHKIQIFYYESDYELKNRCFLIQWFVQFCNFCANHFQTSSLRNQILSKTYNSLNFSDKEKNPYPLLQKDRSEGNDDPSIYTDKDVSHITNKLLYPQDTLVQKDLSASVRIPIPNNDEEDYD